MDSLISMILTGLLFQTFQKLRKHFDQSFFDFGIIKVKIAAFLISPLLTLKIFHSIAFYMENVQLRM